jgi:hypothetical protein
MRRVRNPISPNEIALMGLFASFGFGLVVDKLKRDKSDDLTKKMIKKLREKGLEEKFEDVEIEKDGMLIRDIRDYGFNDPRLDQKKIAFILLLDKHGGVYLRKNPKSGRMYVDGYELPETMMTGNLAMSY